MSWNSKKKNVERPEGSEKIRNLWQQWNDIGQNKRVGVIPVVGGFVAGRTPIRRYNPVASGKNRFIPLLYRFLSFYLSLEIDSARCPKPLYLQPQYGMKYPSDTNRASPIVIVPLDGDHLGNVLSHHNSPQRNTGPLGFATHCDSADTIFPDSPLSNSRATLPRCAAWHRIAERSCTG
jgi:hypothetical protein